VTPSTLPTNVPPTPAPTIAPTAVPTAAAEQPAAKSQSLTAYLAFIVLAGMLGVGLFVMRRTRKQ
jgi:hypothetical protein